MGPVAGQGPRSRIRCSKYNRKVSTYVLNRHDSIVNESFCPPENLPNTAALEKQALVHFVYPNSQREHLSITTPLASDHMMSQRWSDGAYTALRKLPHKQWLVISSLLIQKGGLWVRQLLKRT